MGSVKKQILVTIFWIIVNIIWTVIGTIGLLFLGITILRDYNSQDWLKYILSLLIFGTFQGLLIALCQVSILWISRLPRTKIFRLSLANTIGAIAGMVVPGICIGISAVNNNALILIVIWNLSLFFSGVLWGLAAGNNVSQKFNWAIATGFAYPLWGTAFLLGQALLSAYIKHSDIGILCISLIFMGLFYGVGFMLNIPKFINLLNKY